MVSQTNKPETDDDISHTKGSKNNAALRSHNPDVDDSGSEENDRADKIGSYFSDLKNACKREIRTPRFYLEVAALLGLALYTCETRRTNDLTQDSLRANLVNSGQWDFLDPVAENIHITAKGTMKNVGRARAVIWYRFESHRWKGLPDGDIPIRVADSPQTVDPDNPIVFAIRDPDPAPKEFIDGIPYMQDLSRNSTSGVLEPSTNKTTLFFIGKVVYKSMGKELGRNYCFYIVHVDSHDKLLQLQAPPTDPNYLFVNCPKWNDINE